MVCYLQLNDIIEFSCACKDFYRVSRNNSSYLKKLKELERIFKDKSDAVSAYSNFCREFYLALFRRLRPFVKVDSISRVKKIIWSELFYTILPFRVWNHLFLCCRSQYESNMSLYCTKIYLKDKKLSASINKSLTVDRVDCFPVCISDGIIIGGHVHLFVHLSIADRQKQLPYNANFGNLFYEVINSPFMLQKLYLDTLARIVFNYFPIF